jgi:hypothetical protein
MFKFFPGEPTQASAEHHWNTWLQVCDYLLHMEAQTQLFYLGLKFFKSQASYLHTKSAFIWTVFTKGATSAFFFLLLISVDMSLTFLQSSPRKYSGEKETDLNDLSHLSLLMTALRLPDLLHQVNFQNHNSTGSVVERMQAECFL